MLPITISPLITNLSNDILKQYLKEINKIPLLDITEERDLLEKIQQGDKEAVKKLVLANLRFVFSIAKKYQNTSLEILDLVQAGNLGLIEAAVTYNIASTVKFISYAVWYIRASITREISDTLRVVRPSYAQVIAYKKILTLLQNSREYENNEKIAEIEQRYKCLANDAVSSATEYSPLEEAETLYNIYSDSDLMEEFCADEYKQMINNVLNALPEDQHDIIRLYFGIGVSIMTLEDISSLFGCCSAFITQKINNIISKLKKNYTLNQLL